MDLYEEIAQELLRAIRGKRSQIAFARRLGYRANPITDWENGRRYPTIHEALRAAGLVGLAVDAAFEDFVALPSPLSCNQSVHNWLRGLKGTVSTVELARHTDCSRYAIGRWLSGKAKPRLPDFLRLVDGITGRVQDWIFRFVSVQSIPSLGARHLQVQAARHLAFERPWSEAVLRILETREYQGLVRHSDEYIARRLGIEPDEIERLLEELEAAHLVAMEDDRFRPVESLTVDTSATDAEVRKLRLHWAKNGFDRLAVSRSEDWFAYNVIAVSKADSGRIEQRLRVAYREVRSIVSESNNPEVAAVLTMQLVRW